MDVTVRPYDPDRDRDALWACKRGFERGLGTGTDDEAKASRYAGKLTVSYREEWLEWVDRCVADDERCVTVASAPDETGASVPNETGASASEETGASAPDETGASAPGTDGDAAGSDDTGHLLGYVFVLPERLAYVWDAAVLNELFVVPAARGTGVADDLMGAAVALARDQSLPLDRLVLDVDRENERARAFYDRHGFAHWGEMVAKNL